MKPFNLSSENNRERAVSPQRSRSAPNKFKKRQKISKEVNETEIAARREVSRRINGYLSEVDSLQNDE